jgi:thiamine transport system permease protein
LPVEIYRSARISLDFPRAGALALIETALAFAAYAAYVRIATFSRSASGIVDRSAQAEVNSPLQGLKKSAMLFSHPLILLYTFMLALLVLGPLLSVLLESFLVRNRQGTIFFISDQWWGEISGSAFPALGRSVLLAFSAASISVCIAGSSALAVWGIRSFTIKKLRSGSGKGMPDGKGGRPLDVERRPFIERALAVMCAAPLASSGIVLGLGYLRFFGTGLGRSFWAPALAHAVSALPFAYGSISEGLVALSPSLSGASSSLGAQPVKTAVLVALPAAKKRILSAWAFAVAISLGEVNTVLMLGLEDFETLPLLIYRASGAYRFGSACAAGVLLASVCAASYALSEYADRPIKHRKGE